MSYKGRREHGQGRNSNNFLPGTDLQLTNTLKSPPKKIVIVGIQPKVVAMGMKLSDEVANSIDAIVQITRQLVDKYK